MIAVLAIIAALVADGLVFYVVGELFAAGYDDSRGIGAVGPFTLVAVVLAAFWTPRVIEFREVSPRWGYAIYGGLMFLFVYGAMRLEFAGDLRLWSFGWVADFVSDATATTREGGPALIGGALIIAAWIRGSWRSSGDFELESVARHLAIPFGTVITVCVLAAWSDRIGVVGQGATAFFAAAVLALAFSQSALSGATIGSLRSSGVTGTLMAATVAVTAVCVVVFGIVFGFLGRQFGGLVESAVYVILMVILTPMAWVFEFIFSWLFSHIGEPDLREFATFVESGAEPGDEDRSATERTLAGFWRVLLLLIALSVVVGAAALATKLYRRGRRAALAGPEATSSGSLGDDLRSLFRRPFGHRTAVPQGGEGAIALYRRVLAEGQRSGRPRAVSETPGEYAPALTNLFHNHVTDEITAAFVEARYAGREPDPALLRELERRWQASRHSEEHQN